MKPWYRAWVGTVSDPKFHEIALMADVSAAVAFMVWHHVLEDTSAIDDHGAFEIAPRRVAASMREPLARIEAVFAAMGELRMIADGHVVKWGERQFDTDAPASGAERVRKHRQRHAGRRSADPELFAETAENQGLPSDVTRCNDGPPLQRNDVTPSESETDTDSLSLRSRGERGGEVIQIRPGKPIRLPSDWSPDPQASAFAIAEIGAEAARRELARFRDYWLGKGANATKADWPATWRNWVRKAADDVRARAGPRGGSAPRRSALDVFQEIGNGTYAASRDDLDGWPRAGAAGPLIDAVAVASP